MDTKEKRDRKPNFSDEEMKFLLEAIDEKDIIHSRLQTSITVKKKKEAWGRIVSRVNAGGKVHRGEDDCRKKWRDLKSAAVKELADQRKTGGGGPMKATPFKDLILAIIGDDSNSIIHGIEGLLTNAFHHKHIVYIR